ncbi:peptidase [Marmoricola endophyticus]|uniref:Neutral metalloproteinase n=1 Tax=Marmoricola endophyticus TaxID=2040280 RepID=A0A917BD92_9ACTN|nr:M4 family metallopeptidase [Marmoricola endophyticus]GGF38366.1 peptidase [Marmoricola endophyticus]
MPRSSRSPRRLASAAAVTGLTASLLALQAHADAAPTADDSGLVTSSRHVAPDSAVATSAVTLLKSTRQALLGDDQGLTVKDAIVDSTGASHVRMTRTYAGLRVLGGDLVLHRTAAGKVAGVSQTLASAPSMSATPKLSADTLVSRLGLKTQGKPELVVDAVDEAPRLAWLFTTGGTQADGTPSRLEHVVDATTGKTIRTEQQIETVDGDGDSLYLGTVPLDLTKSGATYQLKSGSRGGTYTTDVNNKTDGTLCQLFGNCPTGTTFTSSTTHFGGAATNRATAGVDAQRGSDLTWDYYKQTFGRNGIFGTGKGSYNRVHYGKNYVNAFWDGTKMTYGDGDGQQYGPLVSVDVTGHEMSHGVTENTAGLTYSGESGGLNEATSDIFGSMVEFYADDAKDPGDYLIGEQFDKTKKGLRRMDDPASDGKSQSCYSSSTKSVDVHYSSGVGNHFYYLLAEGSGAKTINGVAHDSPTCNGSSVTGIGRDAAQRIWYRALTTYFTSSTTYAQARTATLSAAKDLYGTGSTQYAAVGKAWSAVSVG